MASTDVQIQNLDAELDALSMPTTAEVYDKSRDYDADVVAASGVSRAIGGGGFAIGSSYLKVSTASITGNASGATVHPAMTLVELDGADFEIAGGDPTTLNVLTDCWASFAWAWSIYADTANLTTITVDVVVNGADGIVQKSPFTVDGITVSSGWEQLLATQPVELSVGDALQLVAAAQTSAGTWSYFGNVLVTQPSVWIVRFS